MSHRGWFPTTYATFEEELENIRMKYIAKRKNKVMIQQLRMMSLNRKGSFRVGQYYRWMVLYEKTCGTFFLSVIKILCNRP